MSSPQATTARDRSSLVDSFFKISQRGSTVSREIRGGLVTFFTMAYIVVLNPLIIGTVKDGSGQFIGGGTDPTALDREGRRRHRAGGRVWSRS